MAVRSKMSTARSRGRAVVKTTTGEGDLPKEKPKDYSLTHIGGAKKDKDFSIADITPDDYKLLRKQLRISDNQDFVIPKADYDVWKNTGKKSPDEYFKDRQQGKPNPFQENYEGEKSNTPQPGVELYGKGKAPKAKPDRQNLIDAGKKVTPVATKTALDSLGTKVNKNIDIKGKAAEEDIMVPKTVEGPKKRVVSRKTLAIEVKPNLKRDKRRQLKGKSLDRRKGIVVKTVDKQKNARLSERMKYKKEEKLAGARENVLGMHGVALKDQVNKYGQPVKRGEKLNEGSAQRLKEIKNLYASGDDWKSKVDKLNVSKNPNSKERVEALKGAKADIKEIGKLSRGQVKDLRASSGKKGEAMVKAKSMKTEYKTAKKPVKFSKDDTVEVTAKKVSAAKERKTPAQLKEMKTAYKSATKEARGMTRTKEEKAATKTSVKNTKTIAKEARSYKGDVRKGLRMEKKDALAMKVADKASDAKKARKYEKGKTMRGTSYFGMSELNKSIPLKGAANISKYKEAKLTGSEKKKLTAVGKLFENERVKKSGARQYSSSQGIKQAGARRFSNK
jgi:hypothetical protein